MQFAREDDNNIVFFLHYVGLYTFPCCSCDEVIQLSNASWSHKIKIFLTVECMVCKFEFFFLCVIRDFVLSGLQKFVQGILAIHCLVILLSPFWPTGKRHPKRIWSPLIFTSKPFNRFFSEYTPYKLPLKD